MNRNNYYSGIDWMRLIAAVLILTIHTSPLSSVSPTGDFILTRIIARIAVPFFLMTTGYFTLSRYHQDNRKLLSFLKKTGMIYAAAIVLYLPLNLYNGYFRQPYLLPNILKDLVFDGTLYHLWYLPASMLGMLIAWLFVQKLDYPKGLAAAGFLYLIGLFGDSYYGIAAQLPVLKHGYDLLFELFDYTRNGIFFAPVFLILGGFLAEKKRRITQTQAIAGFLISFTLMFAEAMLLHQNNFQRHDSMYLFLLPCMIFLFSFVLHFRGKRISGLRTASLLIYLIHPMMIVGVRVVAKVTHLQSLLLDNSLIFFAAVCAASLLFSFAVTALGGHLAASALGERLASSVPGERLASSALGERLASAAPWKCFMEKTHHHPETERAYIELNLTHLSHNAAVLQEAMPPGCELMAVVKTEAYGHGSYAVSTRLEKDGVKAFAVATIDEGIRLRRYGIRGKILILGFTDVHRARELKKYHLTQTLIDFSYAARLNRQGIPVCVQIGIDSGMHRLGFAVDDFEHVRRVFSMKYLKVNGMFTHLCCSESLEPEDIAFTKAQIHQFYALVDDLKTHGIPVPTLHIQSSYGLLNYPKLQCGYVREGISLYGITSAPQDKTILQPDLLPVLALKAKVILIRNVPKGDFVGYDRAFRAARDSRIAILPIGYGDGFPRSLSCGNAKVKIGTYTVPVIGRICMDQLAVDITDTRGIAVGDTAVLIDNQKNSPLSAPYVAEQSGSISNELLCRLGARLPVVVTE